MRVALYGRVSKDDGKQSTDNQLHELREYCARSGYTVVHEYVDRASGKTADRPQFKKLLGDASKRKFDQVLFWSLDRFSREGVLETLTSNNEVRIELFADRRCSQRQALHRASHTYDQNQAWHLVLSSWPMFFDCIVVAQRN